MEENMDNQNQTPPENPSQPQTPPPPPPSEPETVSAETAPLPAGEPDKDARMWGMFCHLAAFAGFTGIPFASVVGPLIVWLIKKDDMPFVDDQGKEALNFQISMAIYILICLPLICLAGLGAVLAGIVGVVDLVFVIIAAIESNKGHYYRYPLSIRMIK